MVFFPKILMGGHSAGAHLAALVTLGSALFSPAPDDPRRISPVSSAYPDRTTFCRCSSRMFKTCLVRRSFTPSPTINFVRAGAPPMLLLHGLEDDTVRPKNSRNLAAALHALVCAGGREAVSGAFTRPTPSQPGGALARKGIDTDRYQSIRSGADSAPRLGCVRAAWPPSVTLPKRFARKAFRLISS